MSATGFAVIGAGLAGAATAWRLAQQGHEVTLVERAAPANRAGSSHGSARIFRYAYAEPLYTRLVVRARDGWDELEKLAQTRLVTPTGALDHGSQSQPEHLAAVLADVGVDHEVLDARQAGDRWPQLAFDGNVLWHPGAGVIDAERAVGAMVDQAVSHGARLLRDWRVAGIARERGRLVLHGPGGATLSSSHVVVAAGGWLPDLLRVLPVPAAAVARVPPVVVRQETAFHFPYREQRDLGPDAPPWPTFVHKRADIRAYGLPGRRDAGFAGQKVAEFNGGRALTSAADQDGLIDDAHRLRVVDYVRRHLPGLVPEPYAETTCLFTNTPSEDFVIDRLDDITIVSACSGHGAKFAPLLGELAAGLAAGTGTVPGPFRLDQHTR